MSFKRLFAIHVNICTFSWWGKNSFYYAKYVKPVPIMQRHICEHEIIVVNNWKGRIFSLFLHSMWLEKWPHQSWEIKKNSERRVVSLSENVMAKYKLVWKFKSVFSEEMQGDCGLPGLGKRRILFQEIIKQSLGGRDLLSWRK